MRPRVLCSVAFLAGLCSGQLSYSQAPTVTLSVTSLTFEAQAVGSTSASQPVTITNTGKTSLTINSISPTTNFSQTNNCGTTLEPGKNCTINVTFAPTAAGTLTGTLTITDSATGSPQTVSLSGGNTTASSSLYTLGIAGLDVTAASSSSTSQQYFAEFDTIAPLHWLPKACGGNRNHGLLIERCWIWFDPRIASVPAASNANLSSISSASSLVTGLGSQTIGQIAQSLEFHGGAEIYIVKPGEGVLFGSGQDWARTSVSFIFGGGGVTPVSSVTGAQEFGLNCNLLQQFTTSGQDGMYFQTHYPQLYAASQAYNASNACSTATGASAPKQTTVAFVLPNRSRFYRDYFVGFRMRTFYFHGNCASDAASCAPMPYFPGTLSVTFGQNETVTGGMLRGVVMTLSGSYPFPGTKGYLRIFGSAYMRLLGNQNTTPLVLVPATSFTSLDSPSVVVQPDRPSDKDYFRLGLGVDLISLISGKFQR